MPVAFDDELLRRMSDFIVAVNRLRHAERNPTSLADPTQLRVLRSDEAKAEQAYIDALVLRGWRSPFPVQRAV